eukprot:jgi/Psemu1/12590/gm1.12590_g
MKIANLTMTMATTTKITIRTPEKMQRPIQLEPLITKIANLMMTMTTQTIKITIMTPEKMERLLAPTRTSDHKNSKSDNDNDNNNHNDNTDDQDKDHDTGDDGETNPTQTSEHKDSESDNDNDDNNQDHDHDTGEDGETGPIQTSDHKDSESDSSNDEYISSNVHTTKKSKSTDPGIVAEKKGIPMKTKSDPNEDQKPPAKKSKLGEPSFLAEKKAMSHLPKKQQQLPCKGDTPKLETKISKTQLDSTNEDQKPPTKKSNWSKPSFLAEKKDMSRPPKRQESLGEGDTSKSSTKLQDSAVTIKPFYAIRSITHNLKFGRSLGEVITELPSPTTNILTFKINTCLLYCEMQEIILIHDIPPCI